MSEFYWFIKYWSLTGTFFNSYTLRLLGWVFVMFVGAIFLGVGTKLEHSARRRAANSETESNNRTEG
jgi:hypothetical protein